MNQQRLQRIQEQLTGETAPSVSLQLRAQNKDFLNRFSLEQKLQVEELVATLDKSSSYALSYTLRGVKSLSLLGTFEQSQTSRESFNLLKERVDQLPDSSTALFEITQRVDTPKGEQTYHTPAILNKKAAEQIITEHAGIFERALGTTLEPERLVHDIASKSKVGLALLDDGVLLGILLGYGAENSFFYQHREFLKLYINDEPRMRVPLGAGSHYCGELEKMYNTATQAELHQALERLEAQVDMLSEKDIEKMPGFIRKHGDTHMEQYRARCLRAYPEIVRTHEERRVFEEFVGSLFL